MSARFTYFLLFLLCSLSSWAQDTSYNARVAPRFRTEYQFEVSGNEYKNVIDTGIVDSNRVGICGGSHGK